jgi:hypothetical protein
MEKKCIIWVSRDFTLEDTDHPNPHPQNGGWERSDLPNFPSSDSSTSVSGISVPPSLVLPGLVDGDGGAEDDVVVGEDVDKEFSS